MDLSKYRQLFLDECREHLQVMNRELLRLEQEAGPGGVDALFRAAHSIKGMSASMGYDAVVAVSHALEDILDRLRKKTLAADSGLMALLYEGVDSLGALVAEVEEKGATQLDVADLAARLRGASRRESVEIGTPRPVPATPTAARPAVEVEANQAAVEPVIKPASPEPSAGDQGADLVAASGGIFSLEPEKLEMVRDFMRSGLVPYACHLRVSRDSEAHCARNFIILGRLGKMGMVLASSPTIEEVRTGVGREIVEALLLTERQEDQIRAQLLAIPELVELQVRRLRVGGAERQAGAAAAGEIASTLLAPRQTTIDRPAGSTPGLADRYVPKKASTVRVDTRVLDDLINIVGEMLITRERLQEIGRDLESEELHLNLDRLRVLVRGFQDTIMTVRMMPLELVTDRLPRIVRDLAHQSGKQVAFEVQGQNIELDRAILEELNDVLIHLVRNAIDHGVEPAERRVAAGKPAKAVIRVRAGRERDWVWIRVEDDGRGMDPDAIARSAIARGLVGAERVAAMEPREKLLLCCLPGVSTAERVTDISGRGVGMDVVKSRVDAFGGSLQIDSQPGRGAAVTLRLPLTLAIIRILLVAVGGQEFGLPVSHVLRTAQMDSNDIEWSQRQPMLRLGNRLVPLLDLGALLGLPARDLRARPDLFLAVSEFGERAAGLAVDRLLGTYEVVIKPLGPPLKRVRGLAGVTVMGDGRTVLLLDLAALIST